MNALIHVATFAYLIFAQRLNVVKMQELFKNLPNDPSLDCFISENSSWICYNRTDLLKYAESNDSY